jgi:predicted DNA-binding transcriptional regulator YafY
MTKPANRLLTLILLLQRRPNQNAAELASELGVSVRTIHRYIEQLDEMGIPVYSERGPSGGFSLVRGYKMPPLIFSPGEAAAICLGAGLVSEIWGNLYKSTAQSALAKVENLLPEDQRREVAWARRSMVTSGMRQPGLSLLENKLEVLQRAVRDSFQVDLRYRSAASSEFTRRILDPYAIIFRSGLWYVIGFCHKRMSVRIFRVDRIGELTITSKTFRSPDDFDAREFWENELKILPLVQIKMKFFKEYVDVARNNQVAWDSFELQEDGSALVTMSAPDMDWAASSVLIYGPIVEVFEPYELRSKVMEWAQAICRTYRII